MKTNSRFIALVVVVGGLSLMAFTPPPGSPIPIETPSVPLDVSATAITAGNQIVLDGHIKNSPYYFTLTFEVQNISVPQNIPTPSPRPTLPGTGRPTPQPQ